MIHSAQITLNFHSSWGIGYLIAAAVALGLYFMNKKGLILASDGSKLIDEK
jgi:hypothetical protein